MTDRFWTKVPVAVPTNAGMHCPKGHALSGENVYLWRNQRHCRSCRAERDRRRALTGRVA